MFKVGDITWVEWRICVVLESSAVLWCVVWW